MFDILSKICAPLRRYLRRQAVLRSLSDMNDRLLEDIGITRYDIRAVAYAETMERDLTARNRSTPRANPEIVPQFAPANDDNERQAA